MKKILISVLCLMHVASALSSATIGFVIAELMKSGKSIGFGAVVTLVPYASLDDVQKAVIKKMYVESELAFEDVRGDSIQIQKETNFEQWVAGDSFVLDVIRVDGASVGGFISECKNSFFFIHRLFLTPNYKKSQSAQQAVQLFEAAHRYSVLKVQYNKAQDNEEMLFWKSCGFTNSQDPNANKFELEKSASSSTCQGVFRWLNTKYAPQPQGFNVYFQRFNFKSMRKASFTDVTLTRAPLKTVYEKDNKYDVFYKKECVGSVSYTVVSGLQGNSITVSSLHINEKHRERGLGMCVILRLEKDYTPQEIVAENVFGSAQGFWEKCGFKPLGDASCSHYIKRCNE